MGLLANCHNHIPLRNSATLRLNTIRKSEESWGAATARQVSTRHRFANSIQTLSYCLSSQLIFRAKVLRENAQYIPKQSFLSRRHEFNKDDGGYLTEKRNVPQQNMMTDPSMMTDMVKGNLTNVLPMIIIGGWINWMFSGFITSKRDAKPSRQRP